MVTHKPWKQEEVGKTNLHGRPLDTGAGLLLSAVKGGGDGEDGDGLLGCAHHGLGMLQ